MDERNKFKIAILYMIREFQPISYAEIGEHLEERHGLPDAVRSGGQYRSLIRYGETYVTKLLEMGLIECNGTPYFEANGRLRTTAKFGEIQDYFSISLTDLLKKDERSIFVTPMFQRAEHPKRWGRIVVAMPFKEELTPVFSNHILKVAGKLGVSCKRADDVFGASQIIHDVWSAIYFADLLIVDCTGKNPNVFYELGLAHTLGRKCVLITQSMEDVPFDLRNWRVILYEQTEEGLAKLEAALTETIKTELGL